MNVTRRLTSIKLELLLALGAFLALGGLQAQSAPGSIEVKGLNGAANYSVGGSAPARLRVGVLLPNGAVLKTDPGSAVDLSFSHNAGKVRLLQNSTLSVDKFSVGDSTPGAAVEVQLHLMEGTMLGFEKNLSSSSRYQVKVTNGIADISGSKYRISAPGYFVLLDGSALFAFIPPSGEPVPFELKAPPAVYFSPVEGVKPAPSQLVSEVVLESKGKLDR